MKHKLLKTTLVGLFLSAYALGNIASAGLIIQTQNAGDAFLWSPGFNQNVFEWYFDAHDPTLGQLDVVTIDINLLHTTRIKTHAAGGSGTFNYDWSFPTNVLGIDPRIESGFYNFSYASTEAVPEVSHQIISKSTFTGSEANGFANLSYAPFKFRLNTSTSFTNGHLEYGGLGGIVTLKYQYSSFNNVPEPSTVVIFALGLMGLGFRKAKNQ